MKDDALYVDQIVDAIAKIETFTHGVSRDEFFQNQEKQSAVIMQLAIIGELSKRLSEKFRQRVALPWREIAGFRDRAIHDYFSLDISGVWQTIQDDIPLLRKKLTE